MISYIIGLLGSSRCNDAEPFNNAHECLKVPCALKRASSRCSVADWTRVRAPGVREITQRKEAYGIAEWLSRNVEDMRICCGNIQPTYFGRHTALCYNRARSTCSSMSRVRAAAPHVDVRSCRVKARLNSCCRHYRRRQASAGLVARVAITSPNACWFSGFATNVESYLHPVRKQPAEPSTRPASRTWSAIIRQLGK